VLARGWCHRKKIKNKKSYGLKVADHVIGNLLVTYTPFEG
jgi:hypothetical protein